MPLKAKQHSIGARPTTQEHQFFLNTSSYKSADVLSAILRSFSRGITDNAQTKPRLGEFPLLPNTMSAEMIVKGHIFSMQTSTPI